MYIHPPAPPRFFLRDASGHVFAYDGVTPLAHELAASLEPSRPLWSLLEGARTLLLSGTIAIRDADGDPFDIDVILDALREIGLRARLRRLQFARVQNNKDRFVFRNGPVPYTRKRRGGGGWLRYPRTRQEIAASRALARDEDLAEIGLNARQTGRLRRPPTFWDDIHRRNERNWKRSRGKQWDRSR